MRPTPATLTLCLITVVYILWPALAQSDDNDHPLAWDGVVEVDTGRAYQGPWRMNASRFLYVDDPTVALADSGVAAVAWVDNAARDVFFQSFSTEGQPRFETPVNISRSPDTFSWLPRMVIADDARQVAVLWQEIIFSGGSHGGDILFARSSDGGATFSEPVNLSASTAGAGKGRLSEQYWHNGSLDLAADGGTSLYAVWTEYEGRLWFTRSSDRGETFSTPLHLAGDAATPARGPTLAVEGETIYLAWTVGEDAAADIWLTRSDDGGRTFERPRVAVASGGHADAPKLALGGGGVLHLVYAESAGGPWQRSEIRHTRSEDGGETFDEPRTISPTENDVGAAFPHLALDGGDNLYVAWDVMPRGRQRPTAMAVSVSADGGSTFTAEQAVPGSAVRTTRGAGGSLQGLLMRKLAVNAFGDVAVVSSVFEPDESSHVRLHRGRAADGVLD